MDKDTQKDPKEAPFEEYTDDYYGEDDDSYYFQKAFKSNIKDDPASIRSRPRNIPVSKLQITDEDSIPKMPDKILPKPDTKLIDDKIKALDELIKKKGESIQETKKKKAEAMYGKNEEINKVYEEHKKLKGELDIIKAKLDKEEEEEPLKTAKSTIEALKGDLQKYEKFHFSTQLDIVFNEIKQIQESLSFSTLSLNEERKLNERKGTLSDYYAILKKLKEVRDKNKAELDASYKRRGELKEKHKPLDELYKKIKEHREKKDKEKKKEKDDPIINQFKVQIDLLFKEREQFYIEKDQLLEKKSNDVYEYDNQQKLIGYIKRAKDKIHDMKKRIEKDKKRKEKTDKKGMKYDSRVNPDDLLEDYQAPEKEKKYDKQIGNCDFLASYFKTFIEQSETTEVKSQIMESTNSKLDEDISKGFLKEVKKDDSDNFLGLSQDPKKGKKGKKGKKPTENKYETVSLDFNVVNKIKEAGLAPPKNRSDIPQFLEELDKKKHEYVKDNVAIDLIQNIKKTDAESTKEGESALDDK